MEWESGRVFDKQACAILKDKDKLVAKIYLSPDSETLRFVLPEIRMLSQVKIDIEHGLIDFRRKSL